MTQRTTDTAPSALPVLPMPFSLPMPSSSPAPSSPPILPSLPSSYNITIIAEPGNIFPVAQALVDYITNIFSKSMNNSDSNGSDTSHSTPNSISSESFEGDSDCR